MVRLCGVVSGFWWLGAASNTTLGSTQEQDISKGIIRIYRHFSWSAGSETCAGKESRAFSEFCGTAHVLRHRTWIFTLRSPSNSKARLRKACHAFLHRRFELTGTLSSDGGSWSLHQLVDRLRGAYCGTLAVQASHLTCGRCLHWILSSRPPVLQTDVNFAVGVTPLQVQGSAALLVLRQLQACSYC